MPNPVVDYADTMLVKSLTMRTRFQHSQQLRGKGVGIVNDYKHRQDPADTFGKLEGFSQILNEQSGEKRLLGVLTNPIAII